MGLALLGQDSAPVGAVVVVWGILGGMVLVQSPGCAKVESGGKGGKLENYRQPKGQSWGI